MTKVTTMSADNIEEMRLRVAISAVSEYCKSQPEGSSPASMLYSQRTAIAKAVVAALRAYEPTPTQKQR